MTVIDHTHPREGEPRTLAARNRLAAPIAWSAALAVAAIALVLVKFDSQDPDSHAYALVSARLARLPVRVWIAPEWWGLGGHEGLFREHPIGVFILPALLGKLGVPPVQAAYVVGAALSMAALLLLRRVAAMVVGEHASAAVPWVALILPVAFINRIRATQEYPVLVLLLLAVYATQKSRTSTAWVAVLMLATCAAMLVKGIFVVFVPIVCGLWLVCIGDDRRGDLRAWLGLGLSVAAAVLCALAYEGVYRRVTGDSFLDYYLPYRLGQISTAHQPATTLLAHKLDNVAWYSVRLLWFGFPGPLALLVSAVVPMRAGGERVARRDLQGLCFAIATAAAYIAVMSLGSTRAERFILPAYFSLGIAGSLVARRRWGAALGLSDRLAGLRPHVLALAWLLLFLAALPLELLAPYVKFR